VPIDLIKGKTIQLRGVEERDAKFILTLRLSPKYNKYLSPVDDDLDAQISWLRQYKEEENRGRQFYFIIERHDGQSCGTIRIYDLTEDSFCWGSWILNSDKTRHAAIESLLLVLGFGFKKLGYSRTRFDVRKENSKAFNFYQRLGVTITSEDDLNYYLTMTKEQYFDCMDRLGEFMHW
jgi:RimJ/RimL family protein N-acetyltransferase